MGEVVLAFMPSKNIKDWQFTWDSEGKPCYEQRSNFYCTGDKQTVPGYCRDHRRPVGRERHYNLKTKRFTELPRVYVSHHPQKGEWEHFNTIDDVKQSKLYAKSRDYIN